jgi:preprotein translocase subunit SecD
VSGSVGTRAAIFAALALAAVVLITPTFVNPVPKWWPWQRTLRLGLDLQGGTHLLYTVGIDQAVDNTIDRIGRDLEREFKDAGIGAFTVDRDGHKLSVRLANKDKKQEARGVVKQRFPNLVNAEGGPSDADVVLEPTPAEIERVRSGVVEQALQVIRNRIDQFGVTEPTVIAQGNDEIVVQLPGIQDPQRAKDLIGRTAVLEFKFVAQGPSAGSFESPGAGIQALPGSSEGGRPGKYLVERRPIMTGDVLTDARVQPGGAMEGPTVNFVLDAQGARLFGDATSSHVGRQLAIVLDGYVQSAPVIREAITQGHGQISGRFTFEEAQDLANVLRNGALPAPLTLQEERTVGPSLGKDSIRKGTLSFVVGSLGVIIFMLIYYKGGGAIADGALFVNVLLILAAFAAFGFTLTMPGIAGIVLTVGMAVDANVLILERIREELRLGKTVKGAVEAGYERAWYAIRDSNLTTFASGLILFQFGTGPVRGFAVTLCVGILTSVLTGVFGTRIVYDWLVTRRRMDTVSV